MKHNLTKTPEQKEKLESFYLSTKDREWRRDELEDIASRLRLTRQQVYKWLWDRRTNEKSGSTKSKESFYLAEVKNENESEPKTHKFLYCEGNAKGTITVPKNLKQAVKWTVNPEISAWTANILRHHGWKFIQESSPLEALDNFLSPWLEGNIQEEKKELEMMEVESGDFPIISEFEMVKEEPEIEESYPFFKKEVEEKMEMIDEADNFGRFYERSEINEEFNFPPGCQSSQKKGRSRRENSDDIFESKS